MAARPDPNALLRTAEAHYVAGRHGAALPPVEQVLRIVPGHPGVLHLKGLILSELGRLEPARIALTAAHRGAPADPQIANNLGNLLCRLGERPAALAAYEAAIRASPRFVLARRNRAVTLGELGRRAEARIAFASLVADEPGDAETRFAMAALEREAGDLPATAARLDETLAIDPAHGPARAARARIAADRGEPDAMSRLRSAIAADPGDAELLLALLAAARSADSREEAVARVSRRLAADPGWVAGHEAIAASLWADGRPDFAAGLERVVAGHSRDVALWKALIGALARADDYAGAAAACLRAEAATGLPAFAAAAFAHLGAAGDTGAADALLARLPAGAIALPALAKHRLRGHDPGAAASLLERAVAANRDNIEAWALLGIAWELIGDDRAEWLNGQPGLIGVHDLGLGAHAATELIEALRGLHRTSRIGLGQSVRGGTQTPGNLFDHMHPAFAHLRDAILTTVTAHQQAMPPTDPSHPILRHRDRPLAVAGSWSIRLHGGGFHVQHIHPQGVMSAASWWVLPPTLSAGDGTAGWFAIGGAPAHLGLNIAPRRLVEPQVGHLVLFPSTLHHGTRPFPAGERISVAFDLV